MCLAASSGHLPSLEAVVRAAPAHLQYNAAAVLESAVDGGSVACLELVLAALLPEGAHPDARHSAVTSKAFHIAARGGHLPVIPLLLGAMDTRQLAQHLQAAAGGASAGGQVRTFAWLVQALGYEPAPRDACTAASEGQVAMLDYLLLLLPDLCAAATSEAVAAGTLQPPARGTAALTPSAAAGPTGDEQQGEQQSRRQLQQKARLDLLCAIAHGCPVDTLQRFYDRLWWPHCCCRPPPHADRAAPSAAAQQHSQQHDPQQQQGQEERETQRRLLSAAAGSPTPCWAAKLDFLLSAWGSERVAGWPLQPPSSTSCNRTCRGLQLLDLQAAAARPDFLDRLKHLQHAGCAVASPATAELAVRAGDADVLRYLWDECGLPVDAEVVRAMWDGPGKRGPVPGLVRVLRLVRKRCPEYEFTAAHVNLEASRKEHFGGRPEDVIIWLRERLLCLAASSGHVPSLDAALEHCGCALKPEVLVAAAAAGNVAGCERLLAEGCSLPSAHALSLAAQCGHLPAVQLLLGAVSRGKPRSPDVEAAATGASMGGHMPVVTWLQNSHAYKYEWTRLARTAAFTGQVAVLESTMNYTKAYRDAPASAGQDAGAPVATEARSELLCAIAQGCPLAVMQRHYQRLWRWQWPPPADTVAAEAAEGGNGARSRFYQEENAAYELLIAAAGSPTPCWAAKLDFLLSAWGSERVAQALRRGPGYYSRQRAVHKTFRRPDVLARLQRLRELGFAPGMEELRLAVDQGHDELVAWLLGVCGEQLDLAEVDPLCMSHRFIFGQGDIRELKSAEGRVAALQELKRRGARFLSNHMQQEAGDDGRLRVCEEAVLWLLEVAEDMGAMSPCTRHASLSHTLSKAARRGAGLQLLKALHARGAAVDLAAVAAGGGEEHVAWAVAELEAQGGNAAIAQALPRVPGMVLDSGNLATARWLRGRGLLRLGSLPGLSGVLAKVQPHTFWRLQVWAELQQWRQASGLAAAAGAATAGDGAQRKQRAGAADDSDERALVELYKEANAATACGARSHRYQLAWLEQQSSMGVAAVAAATKAEEEAAAATKAEEEAAAAAKAKAEAAAAAATKIKSKASGKRK
ncbi:hypothetical protein HYH02_002569 [Chlamydomonas schloesseri]|uniref:Uncharacterized protein n=1 Tax=Chlamydomonas schloesseri TaxID=2026947 RepID=A0A836BB48_9CHLO|nr:hypothetical protein HYH02_002569 [Chlamydomonas schloesseri]|eukprot:KAG2453246.1 hypothetical protein HYH02_002569 [Chlamydomonas schloesseri]